MCIICSLIFASSIAVHEFTHYIQCQLDPDVEFVGFGINWETVYVIHEGKFSLDNAEIETQAFCVQIMYLSLAFFAYIYKKQLEIEKLRLEA